MKFLAARRRSPIVASALLIGALAIVGGGYAAVASVQPAEAAMPVCGGQPVSQIGGQKIKPSLRPRRKLITQAE